MEPRRTHTLAFKLTVLETAKQTSLRKAAKSHGVDESCVRRWAKKEAELLRSEQVRAGKKFEKVFKDSATENCNFCF